MKTLSKVERLQCGFVGGGLYILYCIRCSSSCLRKCCFIKLCEKMLFILYNALQANNKPSVGCCLFEYMCINK